MVTVTKKRSAYLPLGTLLVLIGAAVTVMGIAGRTAAIAGVGILCLLMAVDLIWKSTVFSVTVDENGVSQRQAYRKESRMSWEQLELWLTFTPDGKLNSVILRAGEKNWCDLDDLKNLIGFREALELIQRHLPVSKMFDNRGQIPIHREDPSDRENHKSS